MKIRKMFALVSGVLLLASCEFMNQKENFIQSFNETETEKNLNNDNLFQDKETGKVIINIAGSNARMIRPDDNLKLNDYSDWHVYFYGQANFDYVLENFEESFVLPVGNYNVLVTAVNKIEGKEGGDLILSSIQGKSEAEIVAGKTASVCNILMERTKTEAGTGSFEYKFKISKFSFSDFKSKYDPEYPDKEIDFSPIDYVKASLNGLTVSEKYVFSSKQTDDLNVDVVSYSEDDKFFVFSLNGINIKSGFYRLKIDFETSNNTFKDSFDNVTEFYTKALFEYPETLVEIADNGITHLDDTENYKISYEEFNDDHSIDLKKLEKILKTCDKNDERVLEIFGLPNEVQIEKVNNLILKYGIKVDVLIPRYTSDPPTFNENPYIYGVTFDSFGALEILNDFFKDCINLKYVRFGMELYPDKEYPSLSIEQYAFSGCNQIIFEVPEIEIEIENPEDPDGPKEKIKSFGSYVDVFKILGEEKYKIESIEKYNNLFES